MNGGGEWHIEVPPEGSSERGPGGGVSGRARSSGARGHPRMTGRGAGETPWRPRRRREPAPFLRGRARGLTCRLRTGGASYVPASDRQCLLRLPPAGAPGEQDLSQVSPRRACAAGPRAWRRRRAGRASRARRPRSGGRRTGRACVTLRGTICPSTTHGMSLIWPNARIADSPGLRIGVPASTPNTPTLVIVIVPPARSAGWVRPALAVSARSPSALARSGQGQGLRVLDVRERSGRAAVAAAMPRFT